jgi:hypothetical protein
LVDRYKDDERTTPNGKRLDNRYMLATTMAMTIMMLMIMMRAVVR